MGAASAQYAPSRTESDIADIAHSFSGTGNQLRKKNRLKEGTEYE
jgi:hypothetical protein